MSERGQHHGRGRGGGGGPRGGGEHRGGRGGGGGGRGAHSHSNQQGQGQTERPKKENILDLGKYMDKAITVKFNGGREGMFHSSVCICVGVCRQQSRPGFP
jgi:U6 snRNA-associated Sm-like protein LSm7